MHEFMAVVRALGDENRVRALMALRAGELCVCQIIELLGLAPSTVSKHMSILKQARLVEATKKGRWVYYRLQREEEKSRLAEAALLLALEAVSNDAVILGDDERLRTVLQTNPHGLCRIKGRK